MRGLVAIALLAGCSQILGLSNFQTASDAGGGGGDGGIGVDAPPIDAASADAAPPPYACDQLGSALAIVGGSMLRQLGSGEPMYASFGSAACALLGSASALDLTGSNSFTTSAVPDPDPDIQKGSALFPVHAVELAVDTPAGSNIIVDVLVVSSFDLESTATLRSTGPAALVILSSGDITINGLLDVSTGGAGTAGDPASPSFCHDGHGGDFIGTSGDGAAGGAFQGSGGEGAPGTAGSAIEPGPPTAVSDALYFPYRGCQGGSGGDDEDNVPTPSSPGGAVYLVSRTSISVGGAVNAGGQGGQFDSAMALGGGGGGASGGTILLEAPMIDVSGVLAANGGGGASGTDAAGGGGNGSNGMSNAARASGGGSGPGEGGVGAAGSFLNGAPGMPAGANVIGGGGGGGGVGFVVVHHGSQLMTSGSGAISPSPTVLP